MNILYIGSSGALSLIPFKKLLSSEHLITAVGVFNPVILKNKIIALENNSLALTANQHDIPLIDLSQSVNVIIEHCKNMPVDVILMSCYGKRLPVQVSALAEAGCFNMHPSLLPQYRGPEPVFWQMKHGSRTGVSWHHVIEDFDAGDVVKQKVVHLEDGDDYQTVNRMLAETGAELMLELLSDVAENRLSAASQPAEGASYYPYPVAQDFVVDTAWSAQHAFNFMRATKAFGYAYPCQVGGHQYLLDKALDYDNNGYLPAAEVKGDTLNIPCNEGVLTATFTAKL